MKQQISHAVTIITFIFFLAVIYFSYLTTSNLLVYKFITPQEITINKTIETHWNQYGYTPDYFKCDDVDNYIHRQIGNYSKKYTQAYSNEVKLSNNSFKEKLAELDELRTTTTSECQKYFHDKYKIYKNHDFKNKILPNITWLVFSLILFIAFMIQSQIIYKRNKKK